ncbi:SRPBCC domain-containing protein [uncultured Chitinophaga sp.]|jgi:Uncharacterized conserved protein|uniref:SRPBCC domain-containing protein n=1 Tax=uncultured Chitinophaga sp. TaxID=339340 RepID=UPI00260DCB09|nr:SRPBCC domain-containing protein [uncultured Chitinophaga sp.]
MEPKTKVHAENNKQELLITREFELPVDLLFRAYTDPAILEEWMGTKVLKLETEKYGRWQFATTDPTGNTLRLSGVFHEFIPERQITRTFEMENTGLGVQLEFLEFRPLGEDSSKLNMHVIYRSVEERDKYVQIGMVRGVELAHNRLQKAANKFK